jgi:hypothetical protein
VEFHLNVDNRKLGILENVEQGIIGDIKKDNVLEAPVKRIDAVDFVEDKKGELKKQIFGLAFDNLKESKEKDFQKNYQILKELYKGFEEKSEDVERSGNILDNLKRGVDLSNKTDFDFKTGVDKSDRAVSVQQKVRDAVVNHLKNNDVEIGEDTKINSKDIGIQESWSEYFGVNYKQKDIKDFLPKEVNDLYEGKDVPITDQLLTTLGVSDKEKEDIVKTRVQKKEPNLKKEKDGKQNIEIEMQDFSVKEEVVEQKKQDPKKVDDKSGVKDIKVPKSKASDEGNTKTKQMEGNDMSEQESVTVKENIARKILEVAGVNDTTANRIMQNPKAKDAIMKRAEDVLKNVGVDIDSIDTLGGEKALERLKDGDLKGEIQLQSKEVIAQIGREGSTSIDGRDMRGRDNLHEKYTTKANDMNDADFQGKAVASLEYENEKDNASLGKSAGNMFTRFGKAILGAIADYIRPDKDESMLEPWQSALVGAVAFAIFAPPLGAIIAIAMLFKAAKNQFYDGSKLQEWVNENWFASDTIPSKLNTDVLKDINVKDILESKDKTNEKNTQKEEDIGKDKEVRNEKDGQKSDLKNVQNIDAKVIEDKKDTQKSDLKYVPKVSEFKYDPKGKGQEPQTDTKNNSGVLVSGLDNNTKKDVDNIIRGNTAKNPPEKVDMLAGHREKMQEKKGQGQGRG